MTQAWICSSCAKPAAVWIGKCPACGLWGTVVAKLPIVPPILSGALAVDQPIAMQAKDPTVSHEMFEVAVPEQAEAVPITSVDLEEIEARYITTIAALDYVLGDGLVLGSVVLLGGDPGSGKSTCAIQALAGAARWNELRALYVTGEESRAQVAMRAKRVGALYDRVLIVPETDPRRIVELAHAHHVEIMMIDSISTMADPGLSAAPGSVTQVRHCAELLCAYAKETGTCLVMIAHVTKDGAVAGPSALKHLVDVVLHLDVTDGSPYRVLRAPKNRFGDTSRTGELIMGAAGLRDIEGEPGRVGEASPMTQDDGDLPIACAHLYDNGYCSLCGARDEAWATPGLPVTATA